MGETNTSSVGDLVPFVNEEAKAAVASGDDGIVGFAWEAAKVLDKDLIYPIYIQIMKDEFLKAYGHSFCYMCIATHLNHKNDCPCSSHHLTTTKFFPNFLLNKGCLYLWGFGFEFKLGCGLDMGFS
ncbi:hypothetical protein AAC387_Pa02g4723 [Persea americana]